MVLRFDVKICGKFSAKGQWRYKKLRGRNWLSLEIIKKSYFKIISNQNSNQFLPLPKNSVIYAWFYA